MWWFHIEFILYHAYILIITFLPYGYLYLIVQTVGRALRAECSSINFELHFSTETDGIVIPCWHCIENCTVEKKSVPLRYSLWPIKLIIRWDLINSLLEGLFFRSIITHY